VRVFELTFDGLTASLQVGGDLSFDSKRLSPSVRRLGDLSPVLAFPDEVGEPQVAAYYMYRGVAGPGHESLYADRQIRYDITVIPPRTIGREYIKTFGHYHSEAPDGLQYPEVYQVLSGSLVMVLQRPSETDEVIEDLILVEAREGDVILVPPGYGHVTVNPTREILIMANLISTANTSDYKPYQRLRGAAVYKLVDGIALNTHYERVPEPRTVEAWVEDPLGLGGRSIYDAFVKSPERFEFLNRPTAMRELKVYGAVIR